VFVLLAAGLVASIFHLGHPARGWRAASQWRTSWLSREVIVLPAFMAAVAVHAIALTLVAQGAAGAPAVRVALMAAIGISTGLAVILALLLWWCTGMIYACLRMVQDWATPLTPLVFAATGLASGLALAGAWFGLELRPLAALLLDAFRGLHGGAHVVLLDEARASVAQLWVAALGATLAAIALKAAWWRRREHLELASTLQTALAIGHPRIRQISMGFTGGSYNTREFFHGASARAMQVVPRVMIVLGAGVPVLAFGAAAVLRPGTDSVVGALLGVAAALQLAGVGCERWLFFAWARHPQNLYYRR
jgi:DMSO reductase anchor subunit